MPQKKLPKIQKQGECIFCSGPKLSKQHVIPDWISEHLPPSAYKQTVSSTSIGFALGQEEAIVRLGTPFEKNHNAQFGQVKIRNVCVFCNGGWISRHEQKSIPVMKNLILGKDFIFTKADAKAAAIAILLMAMMNEYTDPDRTRRSIPLAHRQFLMNRLTLPPNWYIGVGVMKDVGESKCTSHHVIDRNPSRYVAAHVAVQIYTVRLGRAVFQAVMCEGVNYPIRFKSGQLLQLWPHVDSPKSWLSCLNPLEEDDFVSLSNEVFHRIRASVMSKYSPSN